MSTTLGVEHTSLRGATPPPIEWIPVETLAYIFEFCLPTSKTSRIEAGAAPLVLREVCKTWLKVSEDHPALWAYRTFHFPQNYAEWPGAVERNIRLFDFWFKPSRNFSFGLCIKDVTKRSADDDLAITYRDCLQHFVGHLTRFGDRLLGELAIQMPTVVLEIFLDITTTRNQNFPLSIRSTNVNGPRVRICPSTHHPQTTDVHTPRDASVCFPSIRHPLSLKSLAPRLTSLIRGQDLHHLTLTICCADHDDVDRMYHFLQQCSSVASLGLRVWFGLNPLERVAPLSLNLPRLETLLLEDILNEQDFFAGFISTLRMPILRTLTLKRHPSVTGWRGGHIASLLPATSQLLQTLVLECWPLTTSEMMDFIHQRIRTSRLKNIQLFPMHMYADIIRGLTVAPERLSIPASNTLPRHSDASGKPRRSFRSSLLEHRRRFVAKLPRLGARRWGFCHAWRDVAGASRAALNNTSGSVMAWIRR
ncbi:hypothetical protein BV22DRAFT_746276 [Leucogyrophana mollusca]|uniref:Uncharacterized protein n=1 Tax=Leucogyrophana mollusca TaxID=85980 RepID=A0ACB8B655_9AGAM|nr:hypothetical protein BV22DRAFT_746276 [Leucogyrophana mollusca]